MEPSNTTVVETIRHFSVINWVRHAPAVVRASNKQPYFSLSSDLETRVQQSQMCAISRVSAFIYENDYRGSILNFLRQYFPDSVSVSRKKLSNLMSRISKKKKIIEIEQNFLY